MPNSLMSDIFLVVPKAELPNYSLAVDREYFSKPVRVVVKSKPYTSVWVVTDPIRGHTYHAQTLYLKPGCRLTNKQMAAAKAAIEAAEQAKQPEGAK